jgi:hypothetical protein
VKVAATILGLKIADGSQLHKDRITTKSSSFPARQNCSDEKTEFLGLKKLLWHSGLS